MQVPFRHLTSFHYEKLFSICYRSWSRFSDGQITNGTLKATLRKSGPLHLRPAFTAKNHGRVVALPWRAWRANRFLFVRYFSLFFSFACVLISGFCQTRARFSLSSRLSGARRARGRITTAPRWGPHLFKRDGSTWGRQFTLSAQCVRFAVQQSTLDCFSLAYRTWRYCRLIVLLYTDAILLVSRCALITRRSCVSLFGTMGSTAIRTATKTAARAIPWATADRVTSRLASNHRPHLATVRDFLSNRIMRIAPLLVAMLIDVLYDHPSYASRWRQSERRQPAVLVAGIAIAVQRGGGPEQRGQAGRRLCRGRRRGVGVEQQLCNRQSIRQQSSLASCRVNAWFIRRALWLMVCSFAAVLEARPKVRRPVCRSRDARPLSSASRRSSAVSTGRWSTSPSFCLTSRRSTSECRLW